MAQNKIVIFLESFKDEDSQLGDLANDISRDRAFPMEGSEDEIIKYLDFKTKTAGIHGVFNELMHLYRGSI